MNVYYLITMHSRRKQTQQKRFRVFCPYVERENTAKSQTRATQQRMTSGLRRRRHCVYCIYNGTIHIIIRTGCSIKSFDICFYENRHKTCRGTCRDTREI